MTYARSAIQPILVAGDDERIWRVMVKCRFLNYLILQCSSSEVNCIRIITHIYIKFIAAESAVHPILNLVNSVFYFDLRAERKTIIRNNADSHLLITCGNCWVVVSFINARCIRCKNSYLLL